MLIFQGRLLIINRKGTAWKVRPNSGPPWPDTSLVCTMNPPLWRQQLGGGKNKQWGTRCQPEINRFGGQNYHTVCFFRDYLYLLYVYVYIYIYILLIYTYLHYTKAIVYCKYNLCTCIFCIFNAVNHACLRSYTHNTSMHLQPHISTISFQLRNNRNEGSDGRQSKEQGKTMKKPQLTSHLSKWHWSSLPLKIDGMMDFLLEPSYFSFRRVFFQWKLNGSMVW